VRILIDTHAFLWYLQDANSLSGVAQDIIESHRSEILLSIASVWETSIKCAQGKLVIDDGFESMPDLLQRFAIELLPIDLSHTLKYYELPFHHKDPFDRMIAAQAIVEGIDLVSIDDSFDPYFVDTEVKRI